MGIALSAPITTQHLTRLNTHLFRSACIHLQGWRGTQEDDDTMTGPINAQGIMVFGVYDGHGGARAAHFMHSEVENKFRSIDSLDNHTAITQLILEMDADFLEHGHDDGATACIVLAQAWDLENDQALMVDAINTPITHHDKDKIGIRILTVNIGDSRAMIIHPNGEYTKCTEDHKPNDPIEHSRIAKAGGTVTNNRVDGNLALSRAIGDKTYKSNPHLPPTKQKVIAVPDYETFIMKYGDVLLVACDGIFEGQVMDHEKVASIISKKINQLKLPYNNNNNTNEYNEYQHILWDPAIVARHVIEQSLCFGSKDNHTAIVVSFSSLPLIDKRSTLPQLIQQQIDKLDKLPCAETIPGPTHFTKQSDRSWFGMYSQDLEFDGNASQQVQDNVDDLNYEIQQYLENNLANNSNNNDDSNDEHDQTMKSIPTKSLEQHYSIMPISVSPVGITTNETSIQQPSFLELLLASQMYDEDE